MRCIPAILLEAPSTRGALASNASGVRQLPPPGAPWKEAAAGARLPDVFGAGACSRASRARARRRPSVCNAFRAGRTVSTPTPEADNGPPGTFENSLSPAGTPKMTIDDRSGDDKFAELFDHFRESFLSRLEAACAALQTCEFRACDIEGRPLAWVWSDADFGHSGRIGTLSDAKAFANAMINQGMFFAYAKCAQDGAGTIWLTTWEAPDEGPVWPEHVPMSEAESWDGIPHEALALVRRDVS